MVSAVRQLLALGHITLPFCNRTIDLSDKMPSADAPGLPSSRVRASKACDRCNKKRVKCDVTEVGQPCSRCRRNKVVDCQVVATRRGVSGHQVGRIFCSRCSSDTREMPSKNERQSHVRRRQGQEMAALLATDRARALTIQTSPRSRC
jgi:hypothetical protein